MPIDSFRGSGRSTAALARVVLTWLLLTFLLVRLMAMFGATGRVLSDSVGARPFNYGVLLLAAVGAYMLFARPRERALSIAAGLYGVGLGLTFNELIGWMYLGGGSRTGADIALIAVAGLALLVFSQGLRRFRLRHWGSAIALVLMLTLFGYLVLNATP